MLAVLTCHVSTVKWRGFRSNHSSVWSFSVREFQLPAPSTGWLASVEREILHPVSVVRICLAVVEHLFQQQYIFTHPTLFDRRCSAAAEALSLVSAGHKRKCVSRKQNACEEKQNSFPIKSRISPMQRMNGWVNARSGGTSRYRNKIEVIDSYRDWQTGGWVSASYCGEN